MDLIDIIIPGNPDYFDSFLQMVYPVKDNEAVVTDKCISETTVIGCDGAYTILVYSVDFTMVHSGRTYMVSEYSDNDKYFSLNEIVDNELYSIADEIRPYIVGEAIHQYELTT